MPQARHLALALAACLVGCAGVPAQPGPLPLPLPSTAPSPLPLPSATPPNGTPAPVPATIIHFGDRFYDFYVPEVVALGKPFQVFADFDDPCGSNTQEAVVVNLAPAGDAATLSLVQAYGNGQSCPAALIPGRAIGLVQPAQTGLLRITANIGGSPVTKVVKVVDAGQPVPPWAPPTDLSRGGPPEPSPTVVPSVPCDHPIDPIVILQGRVFDQTGLPLRVPAEVTIVSLQPTAPYTASTTTAGDGDASRFVINNLPEGIKLRVTVQIACGPRVVREMVSKAGTLSSTGSCLPSMLNFGGPATEADLDAPAYYVWLPPAYSPAPLSGSPSPCPVPQWSVAPN